MQENTNNASQNEKKIDYFFILIAPLKYKVFIIIFTALVSFFTAAILIVSTRLPREKSFLPNKYKSEAKILIPFKENNNRTDALGELANKSMGGLNFERGVRISNVIIDILKTNVVLDGVIHEYYLDKKPDLKEAFQNKKLRIEMLRKMILSNVYLKSSEDTSFIYIIFEDTDPVVAKETVDKFVEMLKRVTNNFALTQAVLKKRFIEDRLKETQEKLKQAKVDFINFQQTYGIISPKIEAEQLTNTIALLRSQLINKEAELENYRRINKIDKNEVTDLDYEVRDLRKKILKLTDNNNGNLRDKNLIISKSAISELTSLYENLRINVENYESIHSSLLKELEIAQIQEKSDGSFIQVIDAAEVATLKSGPSRFMILVKTAAACLFASMVLAIAFEFYNLHIKTNRDFNEKLKLLNSYLSFRKKKQ